MKEELIKLREVMKKNNIDAWLCPSSDAHSSEYLSEYDKERAFISGFTGSAGTLLVMLDKAFLWTDGRYFVQANKQLTGSGIELMKMGEALVPSISEYLFDNLSNNSTLGFSAKLLNVKQALFYKEKFKDKNIKFKIEQDIVEEVWNNRPKRSANPIFVLDVAFTGESFIDKLKRLREKLKINKADSIIVTNLSDIAWISNMRGSDIDCNPQFLSYIYITLDSAIIFIQKSVLNDNIIKHLEEADVEIKDYDEYYEFIKNIKNKNVIIDDNECNYQTYLSIKEKNNVIFLPSIISRFKIVKNATEIKNIKNAHIRDGVYESKFIKWLQERLAAEDDLTEITLSDYLDNLRAGDLKYLSLSFDTISAYGENAAMPHYSAKKETCAKIEKRGLYLVDSGATYMDGTTDVTRTIAVGDLSDEEKLHFTLACIGMLRLMNAKFPKGIKGYNLDTISRSEMWKYGLDYAHGTGHGVGFCNGVHEGPISIRYKINPDTRLDIGFEEGMVVSDEPGIYIAGSHGIRCENLVVTVDAGNGFLGFEVLTMIPLDSRCLDLSIMTKQDIEYFNAYQKMVYDNLKDYLDEEEQIWLANETKAIEV